MTVEELAEPSEHLETWCGLYAVLITRHGLGGITAFSRKAFAAQLAVPGLVAFRAVDDAGDTVGMVLWYCQGDVGYYHLAAYSPRGYAEKASYALFWTAAERLRGRLRWLNLGAGAGATCAGTDGLTRFKRGWSPLTRPTYLGRHVASPGAVRRALPRTAGTGLLPRLPSGCGGDRRLTRRRAMTSAGSAPASARIVAHYEDCLARHGDNHRGVDWPGAEDADLRYAVMLGLIPADAAPAGAPARLRLRRGPSPRIPPAAERAGNRLPRPRSFRALPGTLPQQVSRASRSSAPTSSRTGEMPVFDYVVMNGVFTEKRELSHAEMWDYVRRGAAADSGRMPGTGWPSTSCRSRSTGSGTTCFTSRSIPSWRFSRPSSRAHCVIRHDYGLYEYTTYVYREANPWPA